MQISYWTDISIVNINNCFPFRNWFKQLKHVAKGISIVSFFKYIGIKESDRLEITGLIDKLKLEHGCQIIINGLIPTIKYYLRLITSLDEFVSNYNFLIEQDTEIKKTHKEMWNELINKHLN